MEIMMQEELAKQGLTEGKLLELARKYLDLVSERVLAREAEELERQNWLAARKEEGSKIDPATAKVMWEYGQILDPYGVRDLPPEDSCVGRVYFARSAEPDAVWVAFYDLPEATRDALQARIDAGDPTVWEPDDFPFG
jgi:hypothetical protein